MADVNEEEEFIFEGQNLGCKKELFAQESFVYAGYFNEKGISFDQGIGGRAIKVKKEAVIRRIRQTDCLGGWKSFVAKFIKSNDKSKYFDLKIVLQILAYEDDKDGWRYFAFEPFSTLYHYCSGLYEGPPLPSDPQVIDQMISGIKYLHHLEYPHGDLNPLNVIISRDGRIKLSEFGLCKFSYTRESDQLDDLSTESGIPEICRRKYWTKWTSGQDNERIYELVNDDNEKVFPEEEQDIFAVGCLIVYFLIKMHPFGDDIQAIENNMKSNNPINLEKLNKNHADLFESALDNMIRQPTNKSKWWREAIGKFEDALTLKVYKGKKLGEGSFGKVYEGKYKGVQVAVKQIKTESDERRNLIEREIEEHAKLEHENVLKLLSDPTYDDNLNIFLVLELCAGTLAQCIAKDYNGPELPSDGLVLYQIANGLHYIHSRNLVHRDVKPDNILISMTTPVQMKLSDLGLAKPTNEGCFSQSAIRGTPLWMAPEMLEELDSMTLDEETVQTDTFSTGCVFFYFLTRGCHPFVKNIVTEHNFRSAKNNMIQNKPIGLESKKKHLSPMFYDLICKMIDRKENRIELPEVIKQLTTNLIASRQFKRVARLVGMEVKWSYFARFHPKKPAIACCIITDQIIFYSAENWSIPFSNWKEDEKKFQIKRIKRITTLEWNMDGTQLAAIFYDKVIVCWSYPSGAILFQKKIFDEEMNRIEWNPFRPNVFVICGGKFRRGKVVSLFNSCPVDQRQFDFCTIEREKRIASFQWISENRVALGLSGYGGIEIWEIDESTTSEEIVKGIKHEIYLGDTILAMAWNERTKCLAAWSSTGWMTIWSMDSDQPIHAAKVDSRCYSLVWRPNGKPTDDEGVDAARKSADNFILAWGCTDGRIVIWTPLAKEKTRILISEHSDWVHWLSFSPDGRFLASADLNGESIIWSTENWKPVYIGKREIRWVDRFSWMSSSTDVPDYKLTFDTYGGKVGVVEYAICQSEISSEDGSSHLTDGQGMTKTRSEWSIGSSCDKK